MDNGLTIYDKVMAFMFFRIKTNMKEAGKMIKLVAMAFMNIKMGQFMMEIGGILKCMDKVN